MKSLVGVAVALVWSLVVSAAVAAAYVPPRDDAFEKGIQAEIEARDPEGAALFAKATEARDRDDDEASADLLEKVHARDPWFVAGTRRLCGVESRRGHHDRAVSLCREAYQADPSPINGASLALTLLAADHGTSNNGTGALQLAVDAARRAPDDFFVQAALCHCALNMKDTRSVGRCAAAMRRVQPHDAWSLFFTAI